jgi:hypothetical protein
MEQQKPWPADAIMIVAANAFEENRANMESVVPAKCRDCGQALHADSKSIRFAEQMPVRRGRPILFFCIECHLNYSLDAVVVEDFR